MSITKTSVAGVAVERHASNSVRWYLYVLTELVVVALSGSLIGPVIGGTWGYLWGYLSGWVGPAALVLLVGSCVPLLIQRFDL